MRSQSNNFSISARHPTDSVGGDEIVQGVGKPTQTRILWSTVQVCDGPPNIKAAVGSRRFFLFVKLIQTRLIHQKFSSTPNRLICAVRNSAKHAKTSNVISVPSSRSSCRTSVAPTTLYRMILTCFYEKHGFKAPGRKRFDFPVSCAFW